ncbi:TonB-dependent receptor plug domain-containing protein [Xanthomonas campestris]|uniref:TonB-dependent receptor plug domain-containing protein n=1 Tax=Xanthomonas campestris TaxID=339 RepID=UPI002006D98C|nr:TonB-dependent receptor [Xanthomonas campestris]
MHSLPLSVLAIALTAALSPAWAQESTEVPQDSIAYKENNQAATALQRIEVTGSRLQQGDVSSRVIVIDQEEIKARGVSSVEDLIRTLPQNLATIGAITNERLNGPLQDNVGRVNVSALGSLGVSAANLGGMGAGRTLILVNGRRMAGAAGIQQGFVNLNGIPLSAVERVEITTDGGSAIYGADAMGGVINFILRRDYVGTTVNAQYENSSNDADTRRISVYSGYHWDSGTASVTLSHSRRRPVNNWKSGYTTEDYSAYFNGDPNYDFRSFSKGRQPAVFPITDFIFDPQTQLTTRIDTALTVPAGLGRAPTMDDLVLLDASAKSDRVPELAGPDTKSTSINLNFEQNITDKLTFTANGLFDRSTNSQEQRYDNGLAVTLAPGQFYNPFPANYAGFFSPGTTLYYFPEAEIAAGRLPVGTISNTTEAWTANLGLNYAFNDSTKLDLIYTTSRSTNKGASRNFASVVTSFEPDPGAANGLRCANFDLDNNRLSGAALQQLQAIFARQCQALTSTDPSLAFNPWNTAGDAIGADINDFYYTLDNEDRASRLQNLELRLSGSAFELPGGRVYYAVGADYNEDGVDSREVRNLSVLATNRDRYAYFAEAAIPVFGNAFSFPLMKSLTFNLAARRDTYTSEGAIGTVDNVPYIEGGEILFGKNKFAKTTPSFGALWELTDSLRVRARWSRGFSAPPPTNLFNISGTQSFTTHIFNDPLYACSTDCAFGGSNAYAARAVVAPNPDLKPETSIQRSYGLSWMPQGALSGLTLDVNYNHSKVSNEYAAFGMLSRYLSARDQLLQSAFYERDASGKVVNVNQMTFNLQSSEYASVTYELGYLWNTRLGTFRPKITWLDNITAQTLSLPGVPPLRTIGTVQGVDDYKVVAELGWQYRDITATLWAYYTPTYLNDYVLTMVSGNVLNPDYARSVESFTTYDLTLSWQMSNDLRLNFAGRNLLDSTPPFVVVQNRPYDTARYNAAGRTLSLEVQYEF